MACSDSPSRNRNEPSFPRDIATLEKLVSSLPAVRWQFAPYPQLSRALDNTEATRIVNQPPAGIFARAAERKRESMIPMKINTGMTRRKWMFQITMDTRATSQVVMKLTPITQVP